jgi:hypothetical protein
MPLRKFGVCKVEVGEIQAIETDYDLVGIDLVCWWLLCEVHHALIFVILARALECTDVNLAVAAEVNRERHLVL